MFARCEVAEEQRIIRRAAKYLPDGETPAGWFPDTGQLPGVHPDRELHCGG